MAICRGDKIKKNMEFQGTKGQWSVDGFNTTSVIASEDGRTFTHVCDCNFGYAEPEKWVKHNTINARLISCAPDLLKNLYHLSMMGLQSERYREDSEYKKLIDDSLQLMKVSTTDF